jgi:predicted glutamine amidotransferase
MCLISVCPKGTSKNSEQVHKFITRGAETNRCGSGIMWKINGENVVNIKKGFFNIQDLHDFVTKLNLGLEDELVIHHRTRTQGNTDEENTHPFIISADHATCVALEGSFNLPMLAHNGMFSDLREYERAGYSDTYAFTKGIMSQKIYMELLEEYPALFKKATSDYFGWSKIAVLHPTKDVIMVGDFVKAEDELVSGAFYFHSNGGYKSYL